MSKKKRRHHDGPPKGAVVLYQESPESKWVNQWFPPKGSAAFFLRYSDAEFARKHPVRYPFAVVLGVFVLLLPLCVYGILTCLMYPNISAWLSVIGCVGAFLIGIGLFNFVAVIVKQYLGHWLSILSFLIGSFMVAISLRFA